MHQGLALRLRTIRIIPVLLCAIATAESAFAQTVRLHGDIPPAAAMPSVAGHLDTKQALNLEIRFALRNQAELDALLEAQQDPSSANYHKWLTPKEFSQRFGPTDADFAAVKEWLVANGFKITGGSRQDGLVKFTGNVTTAEQAFSTRIATFGGTKFGNVTEPEIPAQFADVIGDILGLNNLGRLEPLGAKQIASSPGATFPLNVLGTAGLAVPEDSSINAPPSDSASSLHSSSWGNHFAPADFYNFYDETPLLNAGINGGGSGNDCIAIFALSNTFSNLISTFDNEFGLAAANVYEELVEGTDPGETGDNEIELLLDIEWAHTVAPAAPIILYIGDAAAYGGGTLPDAIRAAVTDNKCSSINISFGICGATPTFLSNTLDPLFAQAAAQGQTVFVASGDSGADTCQLGYPNVNEIAADPNVVSVGGTEFTPSWDSNGNDIGWTTEYAWNDDDGAGGGGTSGIFPKPAWQTGPGVPNDGMRDVPDVAMIASPNYPGVFLAYDQDGYGTVGWTVVGGTSLAAPIWAGISKLIMQQNGGHRLGNMNPRIYQLAAAGQAAAGFRDVTSGDNTVVNGYGTLVNGYSAGAGYDQVTGWGTVDIANFVTAFAASSDPVPGKLRLSLGKINFGAVGTGTSRSRTLLIRNVARSGMLIGNVSLASAPFGIIAGSSSFALASSRSDSITLEFAPTLPGAYSETLMIASNDPAHPPIHLPLIGVAKAGKLAIPLRVTLPKTSAGAVSSKVFPIKNGGLGILHGNVGSVSDPFTVTSGAGSFVLTHGQSVSVGVQFNPTTPGAFSGSLNITSDDPMRPSIEVTLTGTAK